MTVLSGASTELSTAVTVTAPVLAVAPAAMVSVLLVLSVKSPARAGDTGAAATVRVRSWLVAPFRLAVTVLSLAAPDSPMAAGVRASVTVGVASSSVMVPEASPAPSVVETVALVGAPRVTVTVSFGSSNVSPLTGTSMLALREPAAMVTDSGLGSV